MKKIHISIIGLILAMPFGASAASFVVAPHTGTYTVGDTITLTVSVDPAGGTVYTSMLDARFSPNVFSVESFTLNDAMLPLKEPGYDAIDNTAGILTKTGGYTGGISSPTPFGTIVLRAKGSGTGTFSVGTSSMLLAANGDNQITGAQSLAFTVVPAVVPVPKETKGTTTVSNPESSASSVSTSGTTGATTSVGTSTAPTIPDQLASVAEFVMAHSVVLWVLGILAALFGASLFLNRRKLSGASEDSSALAKKNHANPGK